MTKSSPPRASTVEAFVFATVFLDMIGFGIVLPLMPLYVTSMGGSVRTVGLLVAAFALLQLLATPVLGRLSDRWGRRPVILVSLAGNAASMVLFAGATELRWLPLLFASRLLAGATAGNLAACQAALADVTEGPRRAAAMGRMGAALGLGMALGPVMASALAEVSPSAPPAVAGFLALLDFALALFFLPETHDTASTPSQRSAPPPFVWRELPERAGIQRIGVVSMLAFSALSNVQVSVALLAEERFGWGARAAGGLFLAFGVTLVLVQGAALPALTRRFGAMQLSVSASLALSVGLLCIAFATAPPPVVGGVVLVAVATATTLPVLTALASQLTSASQQGVVLGLVQSAGGVGRIVGPLVSGALYARFGSAAPFAVGAAVAALAAVLAAGLGRPRDAEPAAP